MYKSRSQWSKENVAKYDINNHKECSLKIQRSARSFVDHKRLFAHKVNYLSYYARTEKFTQSRYSPFYWPDHSVSFQNISVHK
jgi:hypothetical protein